jgi:hypothetical protein
MEKAYVWAMVAKNFDVPIASEAELTVLYRFDESTYEQLNEDADNIVDAIEDEVYSSSIVPRY